MSTSPPGQPQPVDFDEQARILVAEARGHRASLLEAHLQALVRYENALWRGSWETGYNQGWQDGYAAAMKLLEQMRTAAPAAATSTRPEPIAPPLEEDDPDEGPTAAEIVIDIIAATPGLRGVEIVAAAAKANTPIKERTVRTALHRLKSSARIKNVEERWYMPGDGPKGPHQQST